MSSSLYLICGAHTPHFANNKQGTGVGLTLFKVSYANPDGSDLQLTQLSETPELNPTALGVADNKSVIYTCNETNERKDVGLSAYRVDNWQNGSITKLGTYDTERVDCSMRTGGTSACNVTQIGRTLVVSNYKSGSVCSFRLHPDCSIDRRTFKHQFTQHSNVVKDRQECAHAHCCHYIKEKNEILVADLGADRIWKFDVDHSNNVLKFNAAQHEVVCPAGSGPRHLASHPTNPNWLYAGMELSNEIIHYEFTQAHVMEQVAQPYDTLQGDIPRLETTHVQTVSHIQCSHDGSHIYVANRGPLSSIACFSINQQNGRLTFVGNYSTVTPVPRHFTFNPTGNTMLVAMQEGNCIAVFQCLPNGTLAFKKNISTPTPQYLIMIEI